MTVELAPLEGFTVGITADRRAEEQAELLRRRGARTLHGPCLRTVPIGADEGLQLITKALIGHPPDVLVATTGTGIRSWLAAADVWQLTSELVASWSRALIVARGPKAAGALRTAGLDATWQAAGETLDEVAAHLLELGMKGRRVAIQLDGSAAAGGFGDTLQLAGAELVAVPVYEWRWPVRLAPTWRLVRSVLDGRVDAVTFTSPPAVRQFFAIAAQEADDLRRHLNDGVVAACVGPRTGAAAIDEGVAAPIYPERGRLGLMVHRLAGELCGRRWSGTAAGCPLVVQGRLAVVNGERRELSPVGRRLLLTLVTRQGAVATRHQLQREVWGGCESGSHLLDAAIARLRRRLGDAGAGVLTVPRRGYRWLA